MAIIDAIGRLGEMDSRVVRQMLEKEAQAAKQTNYVSVEAEYNELEKMLENLQCAFAEFKGRLSPVLEPEPPTADGSDPNPNRQQAVRLAKTCVC